MLPAPLRAQAARAEQPRWLRESPLLGRAIVSRTPRGRPLSLPRVGAGAQPVGLPPLAAHMWPGGGVRAVTFAHTPICGYLTRVCLHGCVGTWVSMFFPALTGSSGREKLRRARGGPAGAVTLSGQLLAVVGCQRPGSVWLFHCGCCSLWGKGREQAVSADQRCHRDPASFPGPGAPLPRCCPTQAGSPGAAGCWGSSRPPAQGPGRPRLAAQETPSQHLLVRTQSRAHSRANRWPWK